MSDSGPFEDSVVAGRICRVIFEHAARISRESDISKLLNLNADLARDLTGAERCSMWLCDDQTGEMWTKVAHGVGELRIPAGSGIIGSCITEQRNIIVNDVASDRRFLTRIDQASGYQTESVVAVPLRVDGQVIGALQVLNKPGGFSSRDAELLNLLAVYSASEIQSERLRQEAEAARLLRHELDLARDVQKNLLPCGGTPVRGLEYEGFFRPAKFVGGDYFDFLELPGGLFSITVGDVSGKGIPAAVLMASIHTLLRSHLLRQPFPLSILVSELSHAIYQCSSVDRYSTLFCGVLDAERGRFTYVNAGHPPAFILRGTSRRIERAESTGMPVGLLPSTQYSQNTIDVQSGDLLLCISDGIAEVPNASGVMWEEAEIVGLLLRYQNATVPELINAMVERVDEYSAGTEQHDDMTIAALRIS